MSIPAPKHEISTPEIRFINPRFFTLIRERTEPTDPHRIIHHTTDPKKTPATNSAAGRNADS
jgi:hypothetical protein